MGFHPRYAVALVLGVALVLAATIWSISESRDRTGLPVIELLRVEPLPDPSSSRINDHLNRLFAAWNGERPWTDEELQARVEPPLLENIGGTAAALNTADAAARAQIGQRRLVSIDEPFPNFARVVAVTDTGEAGVLTMTLSEAGRIEGFLIDDLPSAPPLRGWATALALVTAWLFLFGGAAADRYGRGPQAWGLLAASLVSSSAVLVLSRSELAYTAGRVLPVLAVAIAVWLLGDAGPRRARGLLWVLAGAAVIVGALAPLARDAARIGHPPVLGAFADDPTLYRTLLSLSAALVGATLAGVAAVNVVDVRRLSRWRRPPRWAAVAVAGIWAAAALGSAADYAVGDGTWAGGSLRGVAWVAFGAVAAVIALELFASRWDSPELASLVIDLDAQGSELQPAVARALEDATVKVVTSDDGETLLDESGAEIVPDELPAGRSLTLIRSNGTIVGGLVHDAALAAHPARVEAVAAAAGLALEVGRLNRQVMAQLGDVTSSRARIVQASDEARRRVERDLHDGAQQRLVGLGLTIQRARRLRGPDADSERRALLESANREVREIIEDVRAVSRGSHPALLAERGLSAAVDALAERAPVPVRLAVDDDALPPPVATTVYFVVAEALANVAKHARATRVSVAISQSDGHALVAVCDDGQGGAAMTPGSGLQGLDDRVSAAGGTLTLDSGPAGTTLEACIPCG